MQRSIMSEKLKVTFILIIVISKHMSENIMIAKIFQIHSVFECNYINIKLELIEYKEIIILISKVLLMYTLSF